MKPFCQAVKIELWKAAHNRYFKIALFCGLVLQLAQVAYATWFRVVYYSDGLPHQGLGGISLFVNWICMDGYTVPSILLQYLFPLLAALPFGWSLTGERRSGYQNLMLTRQSKGSYFLSKYIACFLAGGGVMAVTVLGNLLLNAMVLPADLPEPYSLVGLYAGQFLSALYYTHPWIHALLWVFVDFLWGGGLACLCMLAGQVLKRPVFVVLIPFVALMAVDYVFGLLNAVAYSPFMLLMINSTMSGAGKVFGEIGVLILLSLLPGYLLYVRREVIP